VVRETGLALITLGVIVLLFVLYQLFGTNLTEARNQTSLAHQFKAAIATTSKPVATTAPTATKQPAPDVLPAVPPGGAIEHLVIPSIHVDKYVVEGVGESDLRRGPGHYPGTAYPGQVGNAAIAGHRTTYGAPFFELNGVKAGDLILITDINGKTWTYVVHNQEIVSPNDVSVLDPTSFPQLTLTTCNPRFSAAQRLIVFARLQGPAGAVQSPPIAVTTNVPKTLPDDGPATTNGNADTVGAASNNLGHGRSSAWTPAVLYGVLAIGLWVLVRLAINRTRRWSRAAVYTVGIAVCLVPLWFVFENAILLWPQSI
jgi:sortase A